MYCHLGTSWDSCGQEPVVGPLYGSTSPRLSLCDVCVSKDAYKPVQFERKEPDARVKNTLDSPTALLGMELAHTDGKTQHTYCLKMTGGGHVLVIAYNPVAKIENQCQRTGKSVKDAHAECILGMQTESPLKSALRQAANRCHKYTPEYGIHFVSPTSTMNEGVQIVREWMKRFPAAHSSKYIQNLRTWWPKDPE